MSRLFMLICGDVKNIYRDSLLVVVVVAPLLILAFVRFGIPPILGLIESTFDVTLTGYHPGIFIFFCGLVPMLVGMLVGFLILDETDEHLLIYFSVTPLGRGGYLWLKFFLPFLVVFCLIILYLYIAGLVEYPLLPFIPIALFLALEAPMMGMLLAGFAGNKVEGLALGKVSGLFFVAPAASVLLEGPIRYLGGISPVFWPAEMFLAGNTSGYFISLVIGMGLHACYFIILYKKFTSKVLTF